MAQYSSAQYYDFVNAQDRTNYWVSSHTQRASGFYSPSAPAPNIDGMTPSAPPSVAGSTDSTPPKMVLRYNDGRPDVPVPSSSHHHRHRTLSHGQYLRGSNPGVPHSRPAPEGLDAAPEEIRVLPSAGAAPTASSSRPHHSRSKSLPRGSDRERHRHHSEHHSHHAPQPVYYNGYGPEFTQPPHHSRHSKPGHTSHGSSSHRHHHHQQYPPNMYHPHQVGPNGVMYSHSAPVPGQYPPTYPAAYPPGKSGHDSRAGHHHHSSRSRSRRRHHHHGSTASLASQDSDGGYYGRSAHGHGIHVITPSPAPSIVGGGSSAKLSSSTYGHSSGKKPFLQRFFSKFSSSSSSDSHGDRRHSMGGRPGH